MSGTKTGASVQILHECDAQNGLRAAKRALRERADHAFIPEQQRRARPDGEKVQRRYAGTEKEELRVELLGDASGGDVLKEQQRQQHLERQLVYLGQRFG